MVTDLYPPVIGGLELHVQNLSTELAVRGHKVSVVTLLQEDTVAREQVRGVNIRRVTGTAQRLSRLFSDKKRRYAAPFPDPETVRAIRRIVEEVKPDIVHAHNWLVQSFLPLKPWSRAKLAMTLHDYSIACPRRDLYYHDRVVCSGPGLRKCLDCGTEHYGVLKGVPIVLATGPVGMATRAGVDAFFPVSHAVARGNRLESSKTPYEVIPNFVPDDVAQVSEDGLESYLAQLPPDGYVLFVGALGQHKGVPILLSAYEQLSDPPPLVLIGASRHDEPLTLPPNVWLLKNWPHRAVMAAWRRSAIAVVPSVWSEPCPTVAMEAMASGRPVVASRVGGLPDLVDDEVTGRLVEPGDVEGLREALAGLLANEQRRSQMGQAGLRKVEAFQASTVVTRIEAAYRSLLDGSPSLGQW